MVAESDKADIDVEAFDGGFLAAIIAEEGDIASEPRNLHTGITFEDAINQSIPSYSALNVQCHSSNPSVVAQ